MERLAITRGKEGYSFIFFLAAQVIFMILQGVSGIDGGEVATFFGVHLRARIMDHVLLIAQFLNMSLYNSSKIFLNSVCCPKSSRMYSNFLALGEFAIHKRM